MSWKIGSLLNLAIGVFIAIINIENADTRRIHGKFNPNSPDADAIDAVRALQFAHIKPGKITTLNAFSDIKHLPTPPGVEPREKFTDSVHASA